MLTVLISTRNGAPTLPTVLESLSRQTLSQQEWKLVVVNNGSTDATHEVLNSFCNRLPLTILSEPKPGKNRALNLAMKHVEGDLILFSDDDVIFQENWIESHRRAADTNPEFSIFSGPILPLWPFPPPEWILKNVPLGTTYAITEQVLPEGECSIGVVWGPNFSIRKSVLDSYGPLPENIGPSGENYAMGSESAFLYKLSDSGHRSYFIPDASVRHVIRAHQMEKEWTLGRAYRFGRGECKISLVTRGEGVKPVKELFGVPRWTLRALAQEYIFRVIAMPYQEEVYKREWKIRYLKGFIYEYRSHHRPTSLPQGK